jgi:hypothetical protein
VRSHELTIARLILPTALRLLAVIRALLLSAGLAALAATGAAWLMSFVNGSGPSQWATPLQIFALEIAGVFLASALGYAALMPRAAVLTDATPVDRRTAMKIVLVLLLAALAAWSSMQAPAIGAWWTSDRALLIEATGTGRDPMGLRIIPQVMLLSLPTLSALALVTFLLTSLVGMLARTDLAFRVLAACTVLGAGLVSGVRLLLHALRALGSTVQSLMDPAADATAAAQVSEWLLRHDGPARDVSERIIWLLCGYAVTVAIAAVARQARAPRASSAG